MEEKKKVGAPLGNKNSTREKRIWGNIVRKLAIQDDYAKLHKVIKNLSLFNPECLGYVYIINPSYALYLVWKIIESILILYRFYSFKKQN